LLKSLSLRISSFSDKVSPVKFFIFTAAIFGLLFILITPPFQAPDEPVHFFRAYQISEFNFVIDQKGNQAGGYLPQGIGDLVTDTATHPIIKFQANKKYDDHKTFKALSLKLNPKKKHFYDFAATAGYPPVSYIPQSIGILIARLLHLPPLLMMYFGRLANLTVWVLMLALVIKWMPFKKWAFVFIGLLPMALFQASSLSSDGMVTGLFALFLAFILKLCRQKTRVTTVQLGILLALAAGMTLTKQVMFLALPLVLLLPTTLFKSRKNSYAAKAALILIPLLLLTSWLFLVRGIDITSSNALNGQNTHRQESFVVHNPHSFINVLWNTYFYNWSDGITNSFIGDFGWMDTPLAAWIVIVGYIGLGITIVANHGSYKTWLNRRQKTIIAAVGFVYWLAVSTALYVYYSPVGYKIIVGLQGRYFFPLVLLLIPVLYSGWLRTTRQAYRRIAVLTPTFLLIASAITIYVRYFVNNV
jgi:uncharacterized membrane protein